MKVGFIGIGNMGRRLAPRLLEAGYELVVYDVVPAALADLVEKGAVAADSCEALARECQTVFACLPGPEDVETVVLQPGGVLAGASKGSVFIDLTTSAPRVTRALNDAFHAKGAEMLDSPVSTGTLLMVGGDHETFLASKPMLDSVVNGQRVLYIGESGMGNIAKLMRQYATYTNFWVQLEALIMGAKAGISSENLLELLDLRQLDRILRREFGTPETATARLDTVAKDMVLALEVARDLHVPAATGIAADDLMKRAQQLGLGKHDFISAIQLLEEMANVQVGEESGK